MRKILLATSALVALAGAAQAAESPIQVTLGGYVDFRAAMFHESNAATPSSYADRSRGDFQNEYGVSVAADGKAAGGIEYGAKIMLDNSVASTANAVGQSNDLSLNQAYVYMSGAFGKVMAGDNHGATDLFVYAPTVGEGQIDGSYTNFTDSTTLARLQPAYFDATESATKLTYYTPKVGNAHHKVQLGVSYAPNGEKGTNVDMYKKNVSIYKNNVEAVAQYTGTFSPVSVVVAPMFASGEGADTFADTARDYKSWGIGAQAMYAGFTFGASYVDADDYMKISSAQTKDQDVTTVGVKYEFDKVAVAANYMKGEGYYYFGTNTSQIFQADYVKDFSAYGLGATYTWFPGMTTAADAVFFDQNREAAAAADNKGHVLMLSQKMAF